MGIAVPHRLAPHDKRLIVLDFRRSGRWMQIRRDEAGTRFRAPVERFSRPAWRREAGPTRAALILASDVEAKRRR